MKDIDENKENEGKKDNLENEGNKAPTMERKLERQTWDICKLIKIYRLQVDKNDNKIFPPILQ